VPGVIRRRRVHQVRERVGHAIVSFLLLLRLGLSGHVRSRKWARQAPRINRREHRAGGWPRCC